MELYKNWSNVTHFEAVAPSLVTNQADRQMDGDLTLGLGRQPHGITRQKKETRGKQPIDGAAAVLLTPGTPVVV